MPPIGFTLSLPVCPGLAGTDLEGPNFAEPPVACCAPGAGLSSLPVLPVARYLEQRYPEQGATSYYSDRRSAFGGKPLAQHKSHRANRDPQTRNEFLPIIDADHCNRSVKILRHGVH